VSSADTGDIARVFRQESGRAVATLVRLFGDIDIAEEAVQEAFVVASERWPTAGLPPNPGGWITTTAATGPSIACGGSPPGTIATPRLRSSTSATRCTRRAR
jgi:hypothetical protein